jgi:hypothetical protein
MATPPPSALARLVVFCAALAGAAAARAGSIFEPLRRVPAGVDVVLVLDRLAEHRASEFGAGASNLAAAALALGAAGDPQTFAAWRSFSARLGLSQTEAFDALLGKRIVLIGRHDDGGELRWALLSAVHPKTSRLLRERLDVSPREIDSQRIIMTVEGGRWLLASTLDAPPAALVLAPVASKSLFSDILDAADNPHAPTLASDPAIAAIRSLGSGDFLFFARGAEFGCQWVGAVANRQGDTLSARVLSLPEKPLPEVTAWPTGRWDELRESSLFALVERLPRREDLDDAWLDSPIRQVLEMPRTLIGPEFDLVLGQRVAALARRDERGRLALAVGVESSDVRALARPGDETMRNGLSHLGAGLGAGAREFNFAGIVPYAVRRVVLERPPGQPPIPIAGGSLAVLWTYRFDEQAPPAGWWLIATDRPTLDAASAALAGAVPGDEARQWLSLFEARPAELMQALEEWGASSPPALAALRWLAEVRLATWADPDGLVRGESDVTLRAPR